MNCDVVRGTVNDVYYERVTLLGAYRWSRQASINNCYHLPFAQPRHG